MKLMELKVVRRVGVTTAVREVVKIARGGKPVMVVMIGLPASGKSSFTKKLEDELERVGEKTFNVASTDDMIDDLAKSMGVTYTTAYNTVDRGELEKKFKAMIKKSVDDGESLLIDRTNLSRKNRAPHITTGSDFVKVAVAFEIDPAVQSSRLKKRAEATGKHIPDEVISNMKRDYEVPTHEEGFDEVIFVS